MTEEHVPVTLGEAGVQLTTMEDAYRFAQMVVRSGLAPKGFGKPEQVMVAVQAGAELGFSPMRSLASFAVIHGKPSLMGDAAKALVETSGLVEGGIHHRYEGEGDEYGCVVTSQRRGVNGVFETKFTVAQAKTANLWGNDGPWTEYPDRMLYYRPLGFHLRDHYSDALMGMVISEEANDYPASARPAAVKLTKSATPDPLLSIGAGVQDASGSEVNPSAPLQDEPEVDPNTGEEIPEWVGSDAAREDASSK